MRADKDQKEFLRHCQEVLGGAYSSILAEANQAAKKAGDACEIEYQKANARRRAGNLVLLRELKNLGAETWRPDKNGNKPKRFKPTQEQLNRIGYKPKSEDSKQYEGKIFEMTWGKGS